MKKLLLFVSSLLAIVAFFMMFVNPIEVVTTIAGTTNITSYQWNYVLFGYSGTETILGNVGAYNGTVLPFVGYLLAIVSGLGILSALIFLSKKTKLQNLVVVCAALLLIVAGVFVLLTQTTFINANEGFEKIEGWRMTFAPIFAGIATLIAGSTSIVSLIFFKK
jgi:hypothetical protein